jgi:hypothetical protein
VTLVVLLVLSLAVLGGVAALVFLWRSKEIERRVQALFSRPPKPPKAPGPNHYYKAYWRR